MYESDLADKKNTSTQYEELMRMNVCVCVRMCVCVCVYVQ